MRFSSSYPCNSKYHYSITKRHLSEFYPTKNTRAKLKLGAGDGQYEGDVERLAPNQIVVVEYKKTKLNSLQTMSVATICFIQMMDEINGFVTCLM